MTLDARCLLTFLAGRRALTARRHMSKRWGAKAAMEHFHIYLYSVNHRATGYMTIIPDTGLSHISRCAGISNIDMLFEPSS